MIWNDLFDYDDLNLRYLRNGHYNKNGRMIKEEYKYSALTSSIIKCAMTVHSALGNGFQEVIYQRALEIEMRLAGLSFLRDFKRLTNKKFK